MTIQETIRALLVSHGLKVYPLAVPSSGAVYPNIVYQMISNPEIRSHSGVEAYNPRFQLTTWAKTYEQCVETAQIVKGAMSLNQTDFQLATKETEFEVKEIEPNLYRNVQDYLIWHTEGV